MGKKDIKLYNIIFPVWLLWLFPVTWVIVIPANFAVDLLVVLVTLKLLKIDRKKEIAKTVIIKVWLIGFLSDFIGTLAMLGATLADISTPFGRWWYDNVSNPVSFNPFSSFYAVLWVTFCVAISAFFIYLLNYRVSFKKTDLPDEIKRKTALSLAVFAAPYLFYIPTAWFF